jgi:hypothetical protein
VRRKPEIIAGSCLFGTSYAFALYVAISMQGNSALWEYTRGNPSGFFAIPVVGPLVAPIASPPSGGDMFGALNQVAAYFLCIVWTAAESIGAGLMIYGIVGQPVQQAELNSPVMVEPIVTRDRVGVNLGFRLDNFHRK